MKHRMRHRVAVYVVLPLILGLTAAYMSGYFLHSLVPDDWYIDGFPVGWKKLEATGIPSSPPVFAFFSIGGFVLDAVFWVLVVFTIIAVFTSLAFKRETLHFELDRNQRKNESAG